jgi:hypothetical protein
VIEQRVDNQITGELMKFLAMADCIGIVETELFHASRAAIMRIQRRHASEKPIPVDAVGAGQ